MMSEFPDFVFFLSQLGEGHERRALEITCACHTKNRIKCKQPLFLFFFPQNLLIISLSIAYTRRWRAYCSIHFYTIAKKNI